jgi:hypothetical protein
MAARSRVRWERGFSIFFKERGAAPGFREII